MIDAHKNAFLEEATELVAELEASLLEIEQNPDNQELIAKIFRALHTIKGSSGMFGFDEITMFTHDIETVYDHIRNGTIGITKEIIDLTLAACDQISAMLKADEVDEQQTKNIISSFRNIVSSQVKSAGIQTGKNESGQRKEDQQSRRTLKTFYVKFAPGPSIFVTGTNLLMLLREIQSLGRSFTLGSFDEIPSLENINPEKCYVSWEILLQTDNDIDVIKDVFIFIEDQCELVIEEFDKSGKLSAGDDFQDFCELLGEIAKDKRPDIKNLLTEFQTPAHPAGAPRQEKKSQKDSQHAQETESVSSIRVAADKLDELVNLVGELVTVQARLSQLASSSFDQNIVSVSEEVERITWSLRDSALNIRMLPIGTTFSKFKRMVRDLSKELGKEVELTTEGAETELDKTVIEKLNDPLIHIIRNCVDHGIELPDVREKAGKPRSGWVQLSARHAGGNVVIEISDDGAGLNREAIKQKAVKTGLIQENAELSDNEIFSLIFAPGFSTAKQITNVSGRGVGMDVVRRAIENLRGTVEVSSKLGEGTTISLRLPLTLAIIDGLLVRIEDDHFILPLSSVEECVELSSKDIRDSHGRNITNIRGGIVPYINLREKFELNSKRPEIQQIVVAKINGNRVGFVVDKVFGQHQTVLKSLGKYYKNVEGVSGATILGDGTVALILDITKLTELTELEEKN